MWRQFSTIACIAPTNMQKRLDCSAAIVAASSFLKEVVTRSNNLKRIYPGQEYGFERDDPVVHRMVPRALLLLAQSWTASKQCTKCSAK